MVLNSTPLVNLLQICLANLVLGTQPHKIAFSLPRPVLLALMVTLVRLMILVLPVSVHLVLRKFALRWISATSQEYAILPLVNAPILQNAMERSAMTETPAHN